MLAIITFLTTPFDLLFLGDILSFDDVIYNSEHQYFPINIGSLCLDTQGNITTIDNKSLFTPEDSATLFTEYLETRDQEEAEEDTKDLEGEEIGEAEELSLNLANPISAAIKKRAEQQKKKTAQQKKAKQDAKKKATAKKQKPLKKTNPASKAKNLLARRSPRKTKKVEAKTPAARKKISITPRFIKNDQA